MCGRYASSRSAAGLAALFHASDATGDESLAASYNVAPTDPVHVIRRNGEREVTVARWGLLPPWARAPREGARMINARSETVTTSRAFRRAFQRRRCLVPADGWYEWLRLPDGRTKQPYFLTPRDGGVLAFAGLWETWAPPSRPGAEDPAARLLTVTILTTAAVDELRTVHDRMPLALTPQRWAEWLDTSGPADPERLLAPPGPDLVAGIELRRVGPRVGDVRNNDPDLIRAVTAPALGVEPTDSVDLTLF